MVGVQLMLLGGGSSCQACGCGSAPDPDCVCNIFDAPVISQSTAQSNIWAASMFLTGSSGKIITSIQLRTPTWTSANSSGATLKIFSHSTANGGIPNAALHTLTYPATLGDDVTFTSVGYTVSANTYYWVVLSENGPWEFTDHNACIDGTVPYCQIRWADYVSGTWSPADGGPYAFRIFGDDI
jgi:hypothetical protein